ncbi:MAG: MBL fold metallo-hydrolase [Anaerolineaceae bacterium]|nr:MBL fold metallo-hydrolase [Anaerolineaceae bacterium]
MVHEIAENVYSVGIVDGDRRTFHGHEMSTSQGTTYNAYLVVDSEQIVLIDTVFGPHTEAFLENIRSVIDPSKITTIVINHGEPDHAGALAAVKQLAPEAAIICSARGAESIAGQFHVDWPLRTVKTGQTLQTGAMTMTFIMVPMCHWPDNMMVHLAGPDILFSNDVFGQHYTRAVYDDQAAADGELWFEAEKYFVNIIAPYGRNVTNRLNEFEQLGLPLKLIAPSHGLMWRAGIAEVVAAYRRYAAQQTEPRVVVAYDTMYESTRLMAEAIAEGLAEENVAALQFHLAVAGRGDVLTHMYGARGLLIGSPVWHMNVLPTVATLLEDLKTLRFKGRLVGAFGSYGWQKQLGIKTIERRAAEAGLEVPLPGLDCQWKPRAEDLESCRNFGRRFGRRVKA